MDKAESDNKTEKTKCKEIRSNSFSADDGKTMEPDDYINKRVVFKIDLYYCKAKRFEGRYKGILVASLIAGALIPVIINFTLLDELIVYRDMITTFLSILIIVLVAIETTYKYREQFREFKKAEDQLRTELYLFQTKSGPYVISRKVKKKKNNNQQNSDSRFRLLVERVEAIIGAERLETILRLTEKSIQKKDN